MIETALHRRPGIVFYPKSVRPGTNQDEIFEKSLTAITRMRYGFFDKTDSARRIATCYKFFFRHRPTIVISAAQRNLDQPFAQIPQAARDLGYLGFNVIVDASDHSFPKEGLTKREDYLEMIPMKKDMIEDIPQFNDLIKYLKSIKMDEVVFETLGGIPLNYEELEKKWTTSLYIDKQAQETVVKAVLVEYVSKAIDSRNALKNKCPAITEFLEQFKGKTELAAEPVLAKVGNADFREVFRSVRKMDSNGETESFLVPSTAAMKIVLYSGLNKSSFEKIHAIVQQMKA
jgi:hypothetical protein